MRSAFLAALLVALLAIVAKAEVCPPGQRPVGTSPGPALVISRLTGADFDRAYITSMYQLHADIHALADQEYQITNDRDLRELARQIRREQADHNAKLAIWYRQYVGGDVSQACTPRLGEDISRFQIDKAFVAEMIRLLGQQRDAARLALTTATIPELRDQAKLAIKAADLEIAALKRWQNNEPVFD